MQTKFICVCTLNEVTAAQTMLIELAKRAAKYLHTKYVDVVCVCVLWTSEYSLLRLSKRVCVWDVEVEEYNHFSYAHNTEKTETILFTFSLYIDFCFDFFCVIFFSCCCCCSIVPFVIFFSFGIFFWYDRFFGRHSTHTTTLHTQVIYACAVFSRLYFEICALIVCPLYFVPPYESLEAFHFKNSTNDRKWRHKI